MQKDAADLKTECNCPRCQAMRAGLGDITQMDYKTPADAKAVMKMLLGKGFNGPLAMASNGGQIKKFESLEHAMAFMDKVEEDNKARAAAKEEAVENPEPATPQSFMDFLMEQFGQQEAQRAAQGARPFGIPEARDNLDAAVASAVDAMAKVQNSAAGGPLRAEEAKELFDPIYTAKAEYRERLLYLLSPARNLNDPGLTEFERGLEYAAHLISQTAL